MSPPRAGAPSIALEEQLTAYVLEDVLIDSGLPFDRKRILEQVAGRDLSAHALTHAHPDHMGSSHAICTARGIPLWAGVNDVDAVERGRMVGPKGLSFPAGKKHPVARALKEGDEVAGFVVLDTPGHSPGHVSFWRASDRTLVCGDVMWGQHPFKRRSAIVEPFPWNNPDNDANRVSARRLAALEPALVCFGHGAPCRDPELFRAAVAKLP